MRPSLKLGSLDRNLYLNIKNGFNLENPITHELAYSYVQTEIIFIFVGNFRSLENYHFWIYKSKIGLIEPETVNGF